MPYYKITIILKSGQRVSGIKEEINPNIDNVYHIYETKAYSHYGSGQIRSFDCVMISKRSNDYKEYIQSLLAKKEAKKWPLDDDIISVTNYNRKKESDTDFTLGDRNKE